MKRSIGSFLPAFYSSGHNRIRIDQKETPVPCSFLASTASFSKSRRLAFLPALFCLLLTTAPYGTLAQKATATINLGCTPNSIAVNQKTNKIYVACSTVNSGNPGTIVVIDGATNKTTAIATSYYPYAAAVNPVTNKVYFANADDTNGTILVLDGATNALTAVPVSFATGSSSSPFSPANIVVNSASNKVYVYNPGSTNITLLNGANNSVQEIDVPDQDSNSRLTLDPISNDVFVSSFSSKGMDVIDGSTNTPTQITTPSALMVFIPFAAAIGAGSDHAYISWGDALDPTTSSFQSEMLVVDLKTMGTSTFTVPAAAGFGSEGGPTLMAFNPVTNEMFSADSADNSGHAAVIDVTAGTAKAYSIGKNAASLAVNPVTNTGYVANFGSNTVTVIDRGKNSATTVTVGSWPTNVVVNSATNIAYVTNNFDKTVTVISGPAVVSVGTTTALSSNANPQQPGGAVTFTAGVTANSGTGVPAGNLTFSVDGSNVKTVALDSRGAATYSTSWSAPGAHTVKASYAGSTGFSASSASLTETIKASAAAPSFSPAGGTYGLAQWVTLSSKTAGATIYYTTNGTVPTTASTKYTGRFVVNSTQTVQAIASASGYGVSSPTSATYAIAGTPEVTTGVVSKIATPSATLTATVNNLGLSGQVWFLWGTNAASLASSTSKGSLPASVSTVPVSVTISGLRARTVYYFQPVATSAGGASYGAVQSFTTN